MFKLFSLQEANKLIPQVDFLLTDMQDAVSDILRLRQEIAASQNFSVDTRNKLQELNFIVKTVQDSKLELDKLGVFIKDVDTGLVDFPSQVGAEIVYLTWAKGQKNITHYHRLSEATALPLEATQANLNKNEAPSFVNS